MEMMIFYILPLLINWIFLCTGKGPMKSMALIMMISIIPGINIVGAIFAFDTVMNTK